MKILIADDEPLSRRLLERTLANLGHEVVATTNGLDAITALSADGAPRLAVIDWMMPGADGLTVCRTIRARPDSAPYVYIVLLTAREGRDNMLAGLEAEADDFLNKPVDPVELRVRLRSGERVLAFQERLLEAQKALRHQATHDNLTMLWNRACLFGSLEQLLASSARSTLPVSAAMIDLDQFKRINDTYGHAAGDDVLRHTAHRLRAAVRVGDLVGRWGGEEFLIVLPNTTLDAARTVAERVRATMSAPTVKAGQHAVTATASIGVACTTTCGHNVQNLLNAADRALYHAKARGRNRVEVTTDIAALAG